MFFVKDSAKSTCLSNVPRGQWLSIVARGKGTQPRIWRRTYLEEKARSPRHAASSGVLVLAIILGFARRSVSLPPNILDVVDRNDVELVGDPFPLLALDIAGPQEVVAGSIPDLSPAHPPDVWAYCSTISRSTARTHTPTTTKRQQEMMDATLTRRTGYRKANEKFQGQTNL